MAVDYNFTKLYEFDRKFFTAYKKCFFVGIDEVGRGSLAGPVIASAFSWGKKKVSLSPLILEKLNDSKKINKKTREKLYEDLIKLGTYGIGYASVLEIEKLNILNATFLAMKRAYENLYLSINSHELEPYILIDGNKFNPFINCLQSPIIDGDEKSSLIASASIIAKVYRDKLMYKVAKLKKYKYFGWQTNVGYGTPYHRQAIKKRGLTPLHRKLFVRKVLSENRTS